MRGFETIAKSALFIVFLFAAIGSQASSGADLGDHAVVWQGEIHVLQVSQQDLLIHLVNDEARKGDRGSELSLTGQSIRIQAAPEAAQPFAELDRRIVDGLVIQDARVIYKRTSIAVASATNELRFEATILEEASEEFGRRARVTKGSPVAPALISAIGISRINRTDSGELQRGPHKAPNTCGSSPCESGGEGSSSCSIQCGDSSSCSASCRSGYYACCRCSLLSGDCCGCRRDLTSG